MSESSIQQELSLGEVISRTFDSYRRNFSKYVAVYLVVEAIIGVLTTAVTYYVVLPTLPSSPTIQQVTNWLPGFLGALAVLLASIGLVSLIFGTIAVGAAIKMTSDVIEKGQADLRVSTSFAVSKLLYIWAVGLIAGIVVVLGLIAIVIPGVLLALMFSLAIPALLIENLGVFESLGRSRKLVGGRWLKSLAVYIVIGIILGIAAGIASLISSPFGIASSFVSSLISAFYIPIIPIGLTIYYYSNRVRITPPQAF